MARTVVVHCHTLQVVSFQRFEARFAQDERRQGSFDAERIAQIRAGQVPDAWARAQPLDLHVPILTVNTTKGCAPGLDAIVAFIRSATEER
ncbi:MAG: hypothetical protein M1396_04145 [Chloroflexi bacterium]|nr:hypothetical protein [Chloroflexota bacterium]